MASGHVISSTPHSSPLLTLLTISSLIQKLYVPDGHVFFHESHKHFLIACYPHPVLSCARVPEVTQTAPGPALGTLGSTSLRPRPWGLWTPETYLEIPLSGLPFMPPFLFSDESAL